MLRLPSASSIFAVRRAAPFGKAEGTRLQTVIRMIFGMARCTGAEYISHAKNYPGAVLARAVNQAKHQAGAMFGLDARLAMMIFAIMSTVAGYVAFGRITTAHTAALIREIDTFTDGLTSYQTDMGTFYLFTLDKPPNDDSSIDDITALWNLAAVKEGFRPRWHGPYVTFESRKSRTYGNWSIFYAQGDRKNYCTTDSDCFIWLSLSQVPAKTWSDINSYYDEGGGNNRETRGEEITTGRVQADGATDPRTLIIRTIQRPQ